MSGGEDIEVQYTHHVQRRLIFIAFCTLGVILVAGFSLTINGRGIGFLECYEYIINHILGTEYPFRSDAWFDDYVLWNTYVPRIVMGILVGCGLAVCGVAMQSLMNNPLADPYTVGISDGACFGAVAAIVTGFSLSSVMGSMGVVTNAFVGGLIPAMIIVLLSSIVRLSPATTILIGVAMSYIFSGLETTIMMTADADTLKEAYLWQIGTLNGMTWERCYIPMILTIVGSAFLMYSSKNLNLLSLGDSSAKSLGLNVDQFRTLCMLIVAFLVASLVSFVGVIGFVGLVAPHLVRMLLGGDNKFVMPASMMLGSLFVLFADLLSRVLIYPGELRVGLIISMIGAPIFLYMIVRKKKGYGEVF
ncbi:MAG: iron ABC transporter permease [Candidatus Methanomethylophilaceae archaeon]|nr:iron ABC transporter permease [Candidatus Methanomethylophilaceae archaeon]